MRQDGPMKETNWQRLARIVDERRGELGLLRDDLRSLGGPSKSWLSDLPKRQGPPSTKMAKSLADLDKSLGWPRGTSWKLALDRTREAFGEEHGEDEARYYVDMDVVPSAELPARERAIRDFATLVVGTLRNMDEVSAELAMAEMSHLLGLK